MSAQDLMRMLDELGNEATPALAGALSEEGELIMTDAKDRTPVESGTLKNSGHVQPPEIRGNDVSVTLAFGGEAEAYALIQHEDLTLHHDNGEAKFLENAMNQASSGLQQRLGNSIKRRLGS